MLLAGRLVFSTAMVGFGVLCLVFVDFIHQLQPVDAFLSTSTPGYGALAVITGLVLIAAGLAIMADFRTYLAATVLAVMFLLGIALLQVPSAFANPSLLRSPWWVRTFEELVLAGAALILAGLASRPIRDRWIRTGRLLFGISLPVFGILHLIYAGNVATLVPSLFPWPLFWAYFTAVANIAAGTAIVTGVIARLAALMAGLMYGTYLLTLHIPNQFTERPVGYRPGMTSLFVAAGFCGAGLIVAGSLAIRDRAAAGEGPRLARIGVVEGAGDALRP
jgi:uncharacterized membrane protein YphA (DoxX/SURF4 family)